MRKFNDEETKQEIILLYKKGYSCRALAKKYNSSVKTVSSILRSNSVRVKTNKEMLRKYTINESFFDEIDTPEKAYILGILYADGSNNEKKNIVRLLLKQEQSSEHLLGQIKNLISPSKPLRYYDNKGYENSKPTVSFVIDNAHISEQLSRLGCTENKTFNIVFPEWLSDSLKSHFIRGYFDGDGSVTKSLSCRAADKRTPDNKYYNYCRFTVSFTGTERMLKRISQVLKENLDIKEPVLLKRHPKRNNNTRQMSYGGNRQLEHLCRWLYKDASLYLKRKHDLFLQLVKQNSKKK